MRTSELLVQTTQPLCHICNHDTIHVQSYKTKSKYNDTQQTCILHMLKKYGRWVIFAIAVTFLFFTFQKNWFSQTKFGFVENPSAIISDLPTV